MDSLTIPHVIYPTESSAFPRRPYVLEVFFAGSPILIVNNHLKCCGDGFIDYGNNGDEEYRRLRAINLLQDFIDSDHQDERVIVVGDFNDEITDEFERNVFMDFIDDPMNYYFADTEIAEDLSHHEWSFPTWPSHLDHILITNELFTIFQEQASEIKTIRVDDFLDGGWVSYDDNISDHRPVIIKLVL